MKQKTITKSELSNLIKEEIQKVFLEQRIQEPRYKLVVVSTELVFDNDDNLIDTYESTEVKKTKLIGAIRRSYNYIRNNDQWIANMKAYDPSGRLIAKFNRGLDRKVTEDSGPL